MDLKTWKWWSLCRASHTDLELMLRMKFRAPGVKFCLIYSLMNSSPISWLGAIVWIPKQKTLALICIGTLKISSWTLHFLACNTTHNKTPWNFPGNQIVQKSKNIQKISISNITGIKGAEWYFSSPSIKCVLLLDHFFSCFVALYMNSTRWQVIHTFYHLTQCESISNTGDGFLKVNFFFFLLHDEASCCFPLKPQSSAMKSLSAGNVFSKPTFSAQ